MLGHRVGRLDTLLAGKPALSRARSRTRALNRAMRCTADAYVVPGATYAKLANASARTSATPTTISCATRAGCAASTPWPARRGSPAFRSSARSTHLFELEILLKGLACFANPRNHPGPPARRTAVVAQDFREHTALAREGAGAHRLDSAACSSASGERALRLPALPRDRAARRWGAHEASLGDAFAQESPERVPLRAPPRR